MPDTKDQFLDRLLRATPEQRVEVHRARWPKERLPLAHLAGAVMQDILSGEPAWHRTPSPGERPDCLKIRAVTQEDEFLLARLLSHRGDGRVWLHFDPDLPGRIAGRSDPSKIGGPISAEGPVAPSGASLLAEYVVGPIGEVLVRPYEIASGRGPSSERGRRIAWEHSRDAHASLGLSPGPPADARASQTEVAAALAHSWSVAQHDLGERVMALLCVWLAGQVRRKLASDGHWSPRDVINQRSRRWLEGTLSTPEALAEYVDIPLKATLTRANRPSTVPPPFVRSRLSALQEVWQAFDAAHATATPERGDKLYRLFSHHTEIPQPLDAEVFGEPLLWRVKELWGSRLSRQWAQGRLLTVPRPVAAALEVFGLPLVVWDRLGSVVAWIALGWETSLSRPESSHVRWLKTLDRSDTPIDPEVLNELGALSDAARPPPRPEPNIRAEEYERLQHIEVRDPATWTEVDRAQHQELFERYTEAERVYEERRKAARGRGYRDLRDLVTQRRREWAARYLERLLDRRWRDDLREADEEYHAACARRGQRPLTDRMFCGPAVRNFANAWCGGQLTPVAAVLGDEREVEQVKTPATASASAVRSARGHGGRLYRPVP